MKLKKTTWLFLLLTFSNLSAQQNLISFPSPEAAELGKYGQVPVSYFNGLPQISIPLYTVKCNDIELPISLSYYAGGNKPDEHPTWVGLGWNLNCGGMITRVTNLLRDETNIEDFLREYRLGLTNNPGYYYRAYEFSNDDWYKTNTNSLLVKLSGNDASYSELDTEPDEFIFNFCGHSGSFYFLYEDNQLKAKVKNKDGDILDVQVDFFPSNGTDCQIFEGIPDYDDSSDKFTIYKTFRKFTVLTRDGFKYEFGGDITSIDFTSLSLLRTNPTSWHLTKITSPNGNYISFNYKKGGNVFVQRKSNYYFAMFSPQDPNNPIGNLIDNNNQDGLSLSIIHPKYLSSINTSVGQTLNFISSKTTELDYNNWSTVLNKYPYQSMLLDKYGEPVSFDWYNDIPIVSYYLKLDRIEINNLQNINLFYSNSTNQRLRLLGLGRTPQNIIPSSFADNANQQRYIFSYNNTVLPEYNSRKTDNWGYYNNKDFSSLKYNQYSTMYDYRSPNEQYCKAEILERIFYPTGGSTGFQYELNQYSKIVSGLDYTQTPFILSNSSGFAGGLRIRSITDYYDQNDNKKTTKTYSYLNDDGTSSSGILSGKTTYALNGKKHIEYHVSDWSSCILWSASAQYDIVYHIFSQNQLLPLSNTNGNHVTYSKVIEQESDGSKTIYTYSNHNDFPDEVPISLATTIDETLLSAFTSKELERGLLKKIQVYNANQQLVKSVDYTYNNDKSRYDNYIKTINKYILDKNLYRYSANKIYTFYPYLKSKNETTYDINGNNPVSIITNYAYNTYNLPCLVSQSGSKSAADSVTIVTKYPFNNNGSLYNAMTQKYMLNYPIETIKYKGSYITGGKLSTYKRVTIGSDTLYVTDKVFSTEITSPLASFSNFNGTTMDSHYRLSPEVEFVNYGTKGNVYEIKDREGISTTYLWGYNYQHPIVEIKNATYSQVANALPGTTPDQLAASSTPDMSTINTLRQTFSNSLVTTYTYLPFIGPSSITDPKGITTTFEFDTFGRLKTTHNNESNILANYTYNYNTPPAPVQYFYNTAISQTFTKNDCSSGSTGSGVTYSVSAGKYTSTVSQADADQQAQNDVSTNGQAYANANGTCSPVISCSGVDQKLVDGVCETGVKVYTKSTYLGGYPVQYQCIYHYEWSDGSWSGSYREFSYEDCTI
jgi:hypothetical protein